MKHFFSVIAAAVLSAPVLLFAQETGEKPAAAPAIEPVPATEPAPAPEPAPSPVVPAPPPQPLLRSTPPSPIAPPEETMLETLPLIPDTPDLTEKPRGRALTPPPPRLDIPEPADIAKQLNSERAAEVENQLRQRIRLRRIKTRALNDGQIQAEWERAQTARTDFEKREALEDYYTKLYDRMTRLDGSLKGEIKEMRAESMRRLKQHRLTPTERPISETGGSDDEG